MKQSLIEYPFYVQLLAMPFMWILAGLKILIAVPIVIVTICNVLIQKADDENTSLVG